VDIHVGGVRRFTGRLTRSASGKSAVGIEQLANDAAAGVIQ
jgi:hypothetical protein